MTRGAVASLVRAMRDYLMGEPGAMKPMDMVNTNMLNPALMQEVSAQLVISHPDKRREIMHRLLALQEPVDASSQASCHFDVLPLSADAQLIVSGAAGA